MKRRREKRGRVRGEKKGKNRRPNGSELEEETNMRHRTNPGLWLEMVRTIENRTNFPP